MSYITSSISKNEKLISIFDLHWISKLSFYVFSHSGIALLFVFSYALYQNMIQSYLYLAFPAGLLLISAYEYLVVKFTEIGFTDKRLILKTGIVSIKTEEINIKAVETIEISQNIFGRILGFGNIKISGNGSSSLIFRMIKDPSKQKIAIENIVFS